MINSILNLIPYSAAYAHCDIPCGIYDVHNLQMAAHTIIRMTDLLSQVKRDDELKAEHDIMRMTHVKEEHANILENELTTLENDYFKEDHYVKYPDLGKLFSNVNTLDAKVRQGIDMESARELLENVMKIAEFFYDSKGLEHARVKSPYPTGLDIVVQK